LLRLHLRCESVYLSSQHLKNIAGAILITPADLVATVGVALGMPINSVKNYDRRLMEAGLRSKKGHGRGSAVMGPEDAAILLASIGSSDEIERAADCVQRLYALPYAGADTTRAQMELGRVELSYLCKIIGADEHEVGTFGGALASTIRYLVSKPDPNNYFGFEVSIAGGKPYAVGLLILKPGTTRRIEFSHTGATAESIAGGLRVRREIIGAATALVADIVAGRKLAPAVSGGAAMVMPQITTLFLNIKEAYEKLCERIEEENRRERARSVARRAELEELAELLSKKAPAKKKRGT
jgi:hypothetical protein